MVNWLLVRRFFMFDTISSIGTKSDEPCLLRYVKSFQIKVKLRNDEQNGQIYPPFIVLEYGEISEEQYSRGERIKFQFSSSYEMKSSMKQSIEVTIFILYYIYMYNKRRLLFIYTNFRLLLEYYQLLLLSILEYKLGHTQNGLGKLQ